MKKKQRQKKTGQYNGFFICLKGQNNTNNNAKATWHQEMKGLEDQENRANWQQ